MTEPVRNVNDLIASGVVRKPDAIMTVEQKQALADSGQSFTVTAITLGQGDEYGTFWQVEALLGNEPIMFRLSSHARRDPFMQAIAANVVDGPIAGLRLVSYPGKGGNAFLQLEPA